MKTANSLWSTDQIESAKQTVLEWDRQSSIERTWSAPVAILYDGDWWEFYVKPDLLGLNGEVIEFIDLRRFPELLPKHLADREL